MALYVTIYTIYICIALFTYVCFGMSKQNRAISYYFGLFLIITIQWNNKIIYKEIMFLLFFNQSKQIYDDCLKNSKSINFIKSLLNTVPFQ